MVHVSDREQFIVVAQSPSFHAHGMDIIGGWCATKDILIDRACMFITRLAAGSTTPERLSGTINVRRTMINAEQSFQESLWTKEQ